MKDLLPLSTFKRLTKEQILALKKLNLFTARDLLYYFPVRYSDDFTESPISKSIKGQSVTIYGVLEKVTVRRSFKGHIPMTEARIADNSGLMRLIWFNQAYIGKMYGDGSRVKVHGIVSEDSKGFFLSNPHIEKAPLIVPNLEESLFSTASSAENSPEKESSFLVPIYRETKGITSNFLYHLLKAIVEQGVLLECEDPLPDHIREALSLPKLSDALLYTHFPKSKELTLIARKRFSFEEIFFMKLITEKEKARMKQSPAYPIDAQRNIETFIASAPFPPTRAQKRAIETILLDMSKSEPMGRLLEGDVGSGKTFVAASAIYATIMSRHNKTKMPYQVAYMAPTEILAKQHFESFCTLFQNTGLSIGLITGRECRVFPSKTNKHEAASVSKRQLKSWMDDGRVALVVGTHALIQKTVSFRQLALVIIDEQHRFGVLQRKKLAEKGFGDESVREEIKVPHLLSMSATPIPRTLALTLFGDLDLSVLDEMPQGRIPITTKLIKASDRVAMYSHMEEELVAGRQIYVICPRIEKDDEGNSNLRSVEEEAHYLAETVFKKWTIDILHGKMKTEEKDEVMRDFLEKKSHILVATSVVEVGVNIPNASVILIEGADRFGLAQLHQLRGRVGRGTHASYCYLSSASESEKTVKRLQTLVKATNGFELAEIDMKERGIGTLTLGKQWGVSDIAMEALQNPKLVELAGTYAKELITQDENLLKYPSLQKRLLERERVHME